MKSFVTWAAIALTIAAPIPAPAIAQDDAPDAAQTSAPREAFFTENGVLGAAWGTDAEVVDAMFIAHPDVTRADMRDIDDTDTTDYLYSYDWTMGGNTYDLSSFVERGNDRFVSVEITQDELAACTALEQHFIAQLGNGDAKTANLSGADGSPYTASTRVWMNGEVAGNVYGYAYLPANGDEGEFCMMKIINAATI